MRQQFSRHSLRAVFRTRTVRAVSALTFFMMATIVLVSTSACTVTPYDQERVDTRISEISFNGGYSVAGTQIMIEALDPSVQVWTQIETATTLPFAFSTAYGSYLYAWTKRVVIPEQFWEPGIFGYRVEVRAKAGDTNLMSVREDINTCWNRYPNPVDFVLNCSAPVSPVARVYTEDYVDVEAGCTPEAEKLINLVNDEREAHGLSRIPLAPSLCAVGQAHAMDLSENRPHAATECNLHSWSDQGDWSPCCYTRPDDGSHPQAACMWNKPRELADYPGYGYENAATCSTAECALELWRRSSGHWDVIMNRNGWKDNTWRAVGAGLYGGYALLWFGEKPDPASP